jgi:hypothetical protein
VIEFVGREKGWARICIRM